METNKILKASMDDLVFEGRNKEYGAYDLRRKYNITISRSAVIASLAFALFIAAPYIIKALTPPDDDKTVVLTPVELMPPPMDKNEPPPPPPVEPPPPLKATVQFLPPKPVDDKKADPEKEPPPQEELKEKDPGTKTQEGNKDGEEEGLKDPPIQEKKGPEILTVVEQMPEYPGGIEELYKFMYKTIRYPEAAREAQVEGKVTLKFVVDETGAVSNIEIVKDGPGMGCGEEAARALKLLPKKFTPGRQNNQPVKVYYNLPIKFKLQ